MAAILVIDDDDNLRGMLREMLEAAGHDVREAANGEEGLEAFRRNPPDLMLTDLVMPDKEGLETISEVRRDYPGARMIAMSGGGYRPPDDYLKMARLLGARRTLTKPFRQQELLEAVRDALAE